MLDRKLSIVGGTFFGRPTSILARYTGNPIVGASTTGYWDDGIIAGEQVFWDTRLAKWVMVYAGLNLAQNMQGLGLAYSDDLYRWTKEPRNPVFIPNVSENFIATGNIVQLSGSSYILYYQSYGGSDGNQIFAATSSDLLTWTRANGGNPVLAPGAGAAWDSDAVFDPAPVLNGSTMYLYYGGQNATGPTRGIGYATATSPFLSFTKYASNPILTPSGGESQVNLGAPSIVGNATVFDMWYDTSITPGVRFINHAHTSDGGATWDVLDRQWLTAGSGWESVQVFDSAAVITNGALFFFYVGTDASGGGVAADFKIGLATKLWP